MGGVAAETNPRVMADGFALQGEGKGAFAAEGYQAVSLRVVVEFPGHFAVLVYLKGFAGDLLLAGYIFPLERKTVEYEGAVHIACLSLPVRAGTHGVGGDDKKVVVDKGAGPVPVVVS
jgi:hypothetical protein